MDHFFAKVVKPASEIEPTRHLCEQYRYGFSSRAESTPKRGDVPVDVVKPSQYAIADMNTPTLLREMLNTSNGYVCVDSLSSTCPHLPEHGPVDTRPFIRNRLNELGPDVPMYTDSQVDGYLQMACRGDLVEVELDTKMRSKMFVLSLYPRPEMDSLPWKL